MNLIAALVGLILFLVIVGVLFWAVEQILAVLPLAEPWRTIIRVIIVVIGVIIAVFVLIWLLGLVGFHVALPHLGG